MSLTTQSLGRNDPCPCGSGNKYKKCCYPQFEGQKKIDSGQSAEIREAISLLKAGKLQESANLAMKILSTNPADADALHIIANVLFLTNQAAQGLNYVLKAIAVRKNQPEFYITLGSIYNLLAKPSEALKAYDQALSLQPKGTAELFNNIGVTLRQLGQYEKAIAALNKAIQINPKLALSYQNAGELLADTGDIKQSLQLLEKALALSPGNAVIEALIARVCGMGLDYVKAIQHAESALKRDNKSAAAWLTLSDAYYRMGNYDRARETLDKALSIVPSSKLILESAFLLPVVPQSNSEIDAINEQFIENLNGLIKSGIKLTHPHKEIGNFPFYLGYYGRNNRLLMEKLASFFESACPALQFTAGHIGQKRDSKSKVKVGFISEHFNQHVISKCFNPILSVLIERGNLDIHFFATSARFDNKSVVLAEKTKNFHLMPDDLGRAQKFIAAHEMDILMYTDIGMGSFSYFLAFARLAPVQCVMSGHPITSGIKTMDYFMSSAIVEADNGQDHYTEKTVLLDGIALHCLPKPVNSPKTKSRKELFLPEGDVKLYTCPFYLHRIHPDMDIVFRRILENDPKARIILFDHYYKTDWKELLFKRFSTSIPENLMARIMVRPYAQTEDFIQCMRHMDVILDAFHFSMATTLPPIFLEGMPVVTLPAAFMRGRVAYKFYTDMDIPELIAKDAEDFAALAVKLANDKTFKEKMSKRIISAHDKIFDNSAYTNSLEKFCLEIADGKTGIPILN